MGNAELRLTLASIESEVGDVKSISMETRDQAKRTNGRVNWMEKVLWTYMGAVPMLALWAGWLTLEALKQREPEVSEARVQVWVDRAFEANLK